jgi:hypothetical protein
MKRAISLFCLSSSLLACTHISSTNTEYKASLAPQGKARGAIIAVADFDDERAPLELTKTQQKKLEKNGPLAAKAVSSSLYGSDANTVFGITQQDNKFTPVSRAMREFTYQELLSSRHATIPVDGQGLENLINEAKDEGADYLLYGEVSKFSFVTDRPEVKPARVALLTTIIVLGAVAAASSADGSEVASDDTDYETTPVTVIYEADLTMKLISLKDNQVVWSKRYADTQERVDPGSLTAPLFKEMLSPILVQATNDATRAISIQETRSQPVQSGEVQE